MQKLFPCIFLIGLFSIASAGDCRPPNEVPLYGEVQKSQNLIDLDNKFIQQVTESFGGRNKAAKHFLIKGWSFIKQGDLSSAIKRLNQSWLLNPNDPDVYWGFATAVGSEGDWEQSLKLFEKGEKFNPREGRFFCDYSNTILRKFRCGEEPKDPGEAKITLEKCVELLDKSAKLQPDFPPVYFFYAVAFFYQEKYFKAWEMIEKSEKMGFSVDDREFIKILESKLPRPKKMQSK